MAVDWEQRIDFDRLRRERLARIKELLAKSQLGALLCFDMNNVRYITATHIGTWAQDKISRFTLLPQNDEPILWDFGSAARHHQQNCPWLGERSRAGIPSMRGSMTPEMGREADVATEDPHRAGGARPPQGTAGGRRRRAARHVRPAARRHQRRRRPGTDVDRARDQNAGRNHAAEHVGDDGGRRVLRSLQGDEAGHARERGGRARRRALV